MKKNVFVSIISSIVLVLTILLLTGCGGSKNNKTNNNGNSTTAANNGNGGNNNGGERLVSSARVIKIVQIDGVAQVEDYKGSTACFAGMNLYDGDTLTVGADSTLVVKFDEDKYVYLGENTVVNIKSEGKNKTNVYVTSGVVLAEVKNKLGEDEEFFLSSNNSVMAVRGTVFGLDVKTVGSNIIEAYAVYRGVTELYVFDKKGNDIISGKISDISNAKLEITIPIANVISEAEINSIVGEWLDKDTSVFDDANDANSKLNDVAITVSNPTQADFEKVINVVDTPVNYSGIEYTSQGFFGEYDGQSHKITVTPTTSGATVSYSEDGINYQSENTFAYTKPGSYRVYYKIECPGEEAKTDFEVVYITKPNIIIDTDYITYDSASGMSAIDISSLDPEDFNRYNGVDATKVFANQKFYIGSEELVANNVTVNYNKVMDGFVELVDGRNTLSVTFTFDSYELTTDVYFLFSDTRDETGYLIGVSNDYLHFLNGNLYWFDTHYTGFTNPTQAGQQIAGNDLLTSFGLDVMDLTTMLINYPEDVIDDSIIATYYGNQDLVIEAYKFTKINFLVFPNATTKGYNETIYVYVSNLNPDSYPTFTINKTTYAYNPAVNTNGVLMDFVTSDTKASYSLDGTDYQEQLYVTEAGTHKVYYRVNVNVNTDEYDILGFEYITVVTGKGEIAFDNKMFITSPVHILSNDINPIHWTVGSTEYFTYSGNVIATDEDLVITSLDDAYEVYSNMIKNSVFYDSISKEVIDATVTVWPKTTGTASFDYKIEAEGYDTLSGTVRFEYSSLENMSNLTYFNSPQSDDFTVTLPVDYTVSLSQSSTAIPSRISFTLENDFINYQVYYSADNGKTWSTTAPKFTAVGEYEVYELYCFVDSGNDATTLVDGEASATRHSSLAANGNFIIDIAYITVTE